MIVPATLKPKVDEYFVAQSFIPCVFRCSVYVFDGDVQSTKYYFMLHRYMIHNNSAIAGTAPSTFVQSSSPPSTPPNVTGII